MSRISTLTSFRNAYSNVNDNYHKTNKLSNLIGSENKFTSFNDLYQGSDIKFAVDLAKANEEADTYIHNISAVKLKLTITKDIVDNALNIAEDVKNQLLIYQSVTPYLSEKQIQSIVKSHLNNLKGTLSSQLGEYYLLSGSKSDIAPIENILNPDLQTVNDSYYKGDDFSSVIKLNTNLEIPCNITANNLAFAKLISALNIVYYNTGSVHSINEAEILLTEAINDLISIRYNVMNNYALLDHYANYWQGIKDNMDENYNNLEEEYHLSLPELFADLANTEVILEASQSMFSKITSINLLDSL